MSEKLMVYDLTCNYLKNPIGLDSHPRFSWRMFSETQGQRQTAYRLMVSSTRENLEEGIYDSWDSGKVSSSNSIHVPYGGKAVHPRTCYWWKVIVYDRQNKPSESEPAFFETGKLDEKWTGKWITAEYINGEKSAYTAPLLRTVFELDFLPVEARLYICGLGYFETYINGHKPSDDRLSPPYAAYDRTVFYMTYDVTRYLKIGKNALGVILGNGWYNCFAEDPWNTRQVSWRHWPKVLAELHLRSSDGEEMIQTDTGWKTTKSAITFNGIRNGEYYDARLEHPGWNTPEYEDSSWDSAKIIRSPGGRLSGSEIQPVRIVGEMPAKRKWKSPSGTWIFDIGQNLSGVARIKVAGKRGTEITIRYADRLKEDRRTLDQDPIKVFIRSGEFQTDKYIKKRDGTETWNPMFVFHGFQYVEVSGVDYEPELETVTALKMHTDFEKRGSFQCSEKLLNKIQDMSCQSTVSNFFDMPIDSPHREKNAWTGDAAISSEQTLLNFAPMASYYKWMKDFLDAQRPNGSIPCVIPSTGWGYNWGNGPDWSSALTLIPWNVYLYCGDKEILMKMYHAIKKHCDFIHSMSDHYIVNYGIGDWCAPFEGPAISVNMGSFKAPTALTDTAYFYDTTMKVSRIAKILGKEEDEKEYKESAEKIRKAFRARFYDRKAGMVAGNCQTSTACMLYYGLAEEDEKPLLMKLLLKQIEEKDNHLDFGVLGIKCVLNILGTVGQENMGLRMLMQKTYPGFQTWIDAGATTLWECWNGGGSHNHHMFSDVSAFLYKYIGGIAPDENEPGFRHILLHPALDSGLSAANCGHICMYGKIQCNWSCGSAGTKLHINVPVGTYATLYLPGPYKERILKDEGNKIQCDYYQENKTGNYLRIKLESGKYNLAFNIS